MERILSLGLANAATATLLALAVWALGLLLMRRRPVLIHSLWLLVLLKLVTPPLFEVPVPRLWNAESEETVSVEPLISDLSDVAISADILLVSATEPSVAPVSLVDPALDNNPVVGSRVSSILSSADVLKLGWLSGTALVLLLAAVRIARFQHVLRLAEPATDEVQDHVAYLSERLGLSQGPTVWEVDAPLAPMLWSMGSAPRLILPRTLWKSLDARQRTLLLVHELAHLKRGDHLVRLFELAVTVCFWWLPTVWWARRQMREAEEACCDAWVVWAFPKDAHTYAETLLDTVDFLGQTRSAVPLLASGFGRSNHLSLQRRLTMIMLGRTPRRLTAGTALGTLGFATCLLPLSPTWAQKSDEKVESRSITIEVKSDEEANPASVAKAEVSVSVATDGDVEVVKESSVAKAIQALKQRIASLEKEGGDKSRSQIEALSQAIKGLEKSNMSVLSLSNVDDGKQVVVEGKPIELKLQAVEGKPIELRKDVVVLDSRPLSPEARAKIEKAKARIAAIQKDLAHKQKELAEAERDLVRLGGDGKHFVVGEARVHGVGKQIIVGDVKTHEVDVVGKPIEKKEVRLFEKRLDPKAVQEFKLKLDSDLANKDQDRIKALEEKLSKLLEEVASLRKQNKDK